MDEKDIKTLLKQCSSNHKQQKYKNGKKADVYIEGVKETVYIRNLMKSGLVKCERVTENGMGNGYIIVSESELDIWPDD